MTTWQDCLDPIFRLFERQVNPDRPGLKLATTVTKLEKRFGTPDMNRPEERDKLDEAVRQAQTHMEGLSLRWRRYLAYGLTTPVAALDNRSIMEEAGLITPLLARWAAEAREKKLRNAHARGLFYSYMNVPVGAVQQVLRHVLTDACRFNPWLKEKQRKDLLGKAPWVPYINEMLKQETRQLEDLKKHVDIPHGSWFWQKLKSQLCDRIGNMKERPFKDAIPWLLDYENKNLIPGVADALLKAMLNRYIHIKGQPVHKELMTFAMDQWGSPQLESNRAGWNDCTGKVRQMVRSWQAEDDVREFFILLKQEGTAVDKRRLDFWLRFRKQIGFTKIWLGKHLWAHSAPDVKTFIQKQGDRLGKLTGSSDQNALFIHIGGFQFIEFTKTGAAARAGRIKNDSQFITRNSHELKLDHLRSLGEPLIHFHWDWESSFLSRFEKWEIYPDTDRREVDRPENLKGSP